MTTEDILSSGQLRQLKLIRFLIQNGSTPQKKIVTALKYSEATLYRDINNLNSIIKPVQIQTNDLIKLVIPPLYSNRYIFSCILKSSPEFSLIEEIYFREYHSLLSLSEKLFISESTTRRIIKKINTILKKYNIKISSNPIKLVGEEESICNLIIRLFEEKYTNHKYPFPKIQFEALQKIILTTLKIGNEHLNYPDLERLKLTIMVIIVRLQNGNIKKYPISDQPEMNLDILNNRFYKKVFKTIFKLELSKENLSHILYPFSTTKFAFDKEHLQKLKSEYPVISNKLNLFKKLIQNLEHHYNTRLEDEDDLLFHMYNTSEILLGFSSILYDKNKEFVDAVTLYNNEFTTFLKKELIQLKLYNIWKDQDIYTLSYVLITHWKKLALQLKLNAPIVKVGLFFDSDVEHMTFIKDELLENFKYFLDIHLIKALTINELKKVIKEFDFVITTVPDVNLDSTPIICIPMYPSASDLENIEQLYKTILLKKN